MGRYGAAGLSTSLVVVVDDDVDGSLGAASGLPEELEHAVARRVSATSRSSGDRRFIRAASGSGPSSPHHDRCRALPSATPAVHRTCRRQLHRSEEHTSELQSLMRISYAVFCLKKKKKP